LVKSRPKSDTDAACAAGLLWPQTKAAVFSHSGFKLWRFRSESDRLLSGDEVTSAKQGFRDRNVFTKVYFFLQDIREKDLDAKAAHGAVRQSRCLRQQTFCSRNAFAKAKPLFALKMQKGGTDVPP